MFDIDLRIVVVINYELALGSCCLQSNEQPEDRQVNVDGFTFLFSFSEPRLLNRFLLMKALRARDTCHGFLVMRI